MAEGHHGQADVSVVADSRTWLRVTNKQMNMVAALALRRVRVRGSIKLLQQFGACFP